MQVDSKLWRKTNISHILNIFTGKVAEKVTTLSDLPPKLREMLNVAVQHLFRRWYFLKLAPNEENTPASMIDYFKQIEKWPKDGQFLIKPQFTQKANLEIELDVDYISFAEQPLIIDLPKSSKEADLYWQYDQIYIKTVEHIKKILKSESIILKQGMYPKPEILRTVWLTFIYAIWGFWWVGDPFIKNSFSLDQFVNTLQSFLKQAEKQGERGVGIDEIIDVIVVSVRKKYPDWAYTTIELEKKEKYGLPPQRNKWVQMKAETFYMLGVNFDRYFLTPLSQYFNVIEPYYMEVSDWDLDFEELLRSPAADPSIFLAKPAASFILTPFGKMWLKYYENIKNN